MCFSSTLQFWDLMPIFNSYFSFTKTTDKKTKTQWHLRQNSFEGYRIGVIAVNMCLALYKNIKNLCLINDLSLHLLQIALLRNVALNQEIAFCYSMGWIWGNLQMDFHVYIRHQVAYFFLTKYLAAVFNYFQLHIQYWYCINGKWLQSCSVSKCRMI